MIGETDPEDRVRAASRAKMPEEDDGFGMDESDWNVYREAVRFRSQRCCIDRFRRPMPRLCSKETTRRVRRRRHS